MDYWSLYYPFFFFFKGKMFKFVNSFSENLFLIAFISFSYVTIFILIEYSTQSYYMSIISIFVLIINYVVISFFNKYSLRNNYVIMKSIYSGNNANKNNKRKPYKIIKFCLHFIKNKNTELNSKLEYIGNINNKIHAIRNAMTSIGTSIQLDYADIERKDKVLTDLEYIDNSIDEILQFKHSDSKNTYYPIIDNIKSITRKYKNTISISFDISNDCRDLFVLYSYQGFKDIIENIIFNIINISRKKDLDNPKLFISLVIKNNKVVIKFIDNAGGYKENIIKRFGKILKEEKDVNNGIGLYTIYNFMHSLGGESKIYNNSFSGILEIVFSKYKKKEVSLNLFKYDRVYILDDQSIIYDRLIKLYKNLEVVHISNDDDILYELINSNDKSLYVLDYELNKTNSVDLLSKVKSKIHNLSILSSNDYSYNLFKYINDYNLDYINKNRCRLSNGNLL